MDIQVSNEGFVGSDGSVYEVEDVPPHIRVSFYPEEIRKTGLFLLSMEKVL